MLALAVGVAGVAILWPRGPREPVYEGKRLSEWIEDAHPTLRYTTGMELSKEQEAALQAIHAIGTNALPWLMYEYTRPLSKWRLTYNRWADRRTKWKFRFDAGQSRIGRATSGLELLGSDIAPALPELAGLLGDRAPGRAAEMVMAQGTWQAVPYFVKAVNSTNPHIQVAAVHGLSMLTVTVAAAVPPLVLSLQSTNFWIRVSAAEGLQRTPFHPELTIPALTVALSDPVPHVQRMAASSLASLQNIADSLIANLRQQMQSTNLAVVLTASNALHLLHSTPARPPAP